MTKKSSIIDSLSEEDFLINKVSSERFDKVENLENQLFLDKNKLQKIKNKIVINLNNVDAIFKYPINFNLDDQTYKDIHDDIALLLLQLADMSLSNTKTKDTLIEEYNFIYATMPKIAEQLIEERIYQPYFRDIDVLKNKCYKILDMLDDYYFKVNKKTPPNV